MEWYKHYLTVYEKPYSEVPKVIKEAVKEIIRVINATDTPIVSVVAIAHNEENRLLACLWSLCNNQSTFPFEIIVINNQSTDKTEDILKELGVRYFNEDKKGPGHARQCGLNYAKGKYYLCIDSDTIYPITYIQTMAQALQKKNVVCAYGLWSFIPNEKNSSFSLFLYETLRDLFLIIQNIKRPELNVRGMVFGFDKDLGLKEGFRTDIIRGEDGSLALALKKYGKLRFVLSRKARAVTGYGTVSKDGTLFDSFKVRVIKGLKNISSLFTSKTEYIDEESNLINQKNENSN